MPKKAYDKFAVLQHIFMQKTKNGTEQIGSDIDFTLREVGEGIVATGGTIPASRSNFALDLTRQQKTIFQRLPVAIIDYGYDLRKKTGKVPGDTADKYCGTFIYRGKDKQGNTIPLRDWLEWDRVDRTVTVKSDRIPPLVREFLSNDQAALFSVIDYCDVLSEALGHKVYRVQSPMKWQPNIIDGLYVSQDARNVCLYPMKAKAISTQDDINLSQIYGQYNTLVKKFTRDSYNLMVRPIAAEMTPDGMLLAVLEINPLYDPIRNKEARMFNVTAVIRVTLDPAPEAWRGKKKATGFQYHPPTRSVCQVCETLRRRDAAPLIEAYEGRASSANGYPFHDWYNFVLGYTPSFPEYMLKRENVVSGDGKVVLDPFVGSGTTQLVCKLKGIPSYGVDANDFMVFAASQKLNWTLDADKVAALSERVRAACEAKQAELDWSDAEGLAQRAGAERPEALDARYISDKPLVRLCLLRDAVAQTEMDEAYRELFTFAISSILVPVSNVRYGPGFGVGKPKDDVDVLRVFTDKLALIIRDLSQVSERQRETKSVTLLGDSRRLSEYVAENSVSLVITSPPYPGDHEYTKHSKLELIFNGYATNLASFRTIKKRMLRGSTTNLYREDNERENITDIAEIREVTDLIQTRLDDDGATSGFEKLYTKLVWEYFGGMYLTLRECFKVLRPGGKIALLVSDSHAFKMVHIQTAELLKKVGEKAGFVNAEIVLWQNKPSTSHKYQLRENILILQKPREE